MKRTITALGTAAALLLSLAACSAPAGEASGSSGQAATERTLILSDQSVTLDGQAITGSGAVTVSNDIVYYQSGMGQDYGEGEAADAHTPEEAQAHTVVTIRQPGTYRVSGVLSAGQLAVDLGEDARTDSQAVVTLILDGVDITCTVAPAVIFYNVFECDTDWVSCDGDSGKYVAASTMDTSAAGANVILADGSVNNISGSYVAKIYKEGTDDKLHKYDGAFYSKMSMNLGGQTEGTGVLNITAENEGLDTELHLTINGGTINIQAQNDGINVNEDDVSVVTINGGTLQINAGLGEEGDGIDSNGCLVINGGNVYAMASDRTPDGGLDADGDILINGGYVVAVGNQNGAVSAGSRQQYRSMNLAYPLPAGSNVVLSDPEGGEVLSFTTEKDCQSILFSSPDLKEDTEYTLTADGQAQQYTEGGGGPFGAKGGQRPDGSTPPPDGQRPDGATPPADGQRPEPPEDRDGSKARPPKPQDSQPEPSGS